MLYLAAVLIVASVALFVAAPLGGGLLAARRAGREAAEAERLEHERALAMQGLRELEFDREMGKLSDSDYESLRVTLEGRALSAMQSIEALQRIIEEQRRAAAPAVAAAPGAKPALHIEPARRVEPPRLAQFPAFGTVRTAAAAPRNLRFCPQCGSRTVADARYCAECGLALRPAGRATGWND